jgi:peptidoglycan/LPS O-acetylase OafA/YrhL
MDLVRGISAQFVLIGHLLNILFPEYFLEGTAPNFAEKPGFFYVQNFGSLVFFVLSGYLISISASEKKKQGQRFGGYFADRFARIYTPYIPVLIFVLFF